MKRQSDIQHLRLLAERIKEGDHRAFEHMFDILWEALYRHTQSIVMDEHVAKDILQEIWIDYWNRREEIETGHIRPYLFKAVKYKSFNYLRDHKFTRVQVEVLESIPAGEEFLEEEANPGTFEKMLEHSLDSLPSRCRSIFKMSRLEGYTNQEIATILNISKRSVENQISIALKKVRSDLKGHELAIFICSLYLV